MTISESFFTINSTTAELYVNSDLEREADMDDYHYYEITVREGGELCGIVCVVSCGTTLFMSPFYHIYLWYSQHCLCVYFTL